MSNVLEYKGYHTKIQYDADSNTLHGKIEGIKDFVNFEAESTADVENEFHAAVDDYLALCEELGKSPDKEFKGSFNVRIAPSLHRELAMEACKRDISLNQLVEEAIQVHLHGQKIQKETTIIIKDNETKASTPPYPFMVGYPSNNYNHFYTGVS